mmetsp:Transcript_21973/g.39866  ORF Transcript_21973/g.39866 Transcript_21973/m.39866 type:complete len:732 (-) Transcript_21973:52-2247(-)
MSATSIAAEVHKIESTVKEELVKASMLLRGEFQQQLNMERQDRQVMMAEIRRELEGHRATIYTAIEKVDKFSDADQVSDQQEAIRKLEAGLLDQQSQQNTTIKMCKEDNELFALKMSAAETNIAELQAAMTRFSAVLENVQQEAAKQAVVHADIVQQHMEVGIQNDQLQDLRREYNAQRLQLVEQGSKFTAVVAEHEALRLKMSAVESSLEEFSANQGSGARSPQDLSMQSELHSHFVGLKESLAQLRSDVAVQSSMNSDYLVQQAGLESLRKEVSKLKLCITPAAVTMNVSLEESIQKLRADMEQKFIYLEQKTQIGIASTIADTLSSRIADNLHKAERLDKWVEGVPPSKEAGPDTQESKERDTSFNLLAAGEWAAAKEAAMEELSKQGSDTSSNTQPASQQPSTEATDQESVWMSADLKHSLTSLVARIQSNLKMDAAGSAASGTPAPLPDARALSLPIAGRGETTPSRGRASPPPRQQPQQQFTPRGMYRDVANPTPGGPDRRSSVQLAGPATERSQSSPIAIRPGISYPSLDRRVASGATSVPPTAARDESGSIRVTPGPINRESSVGSYGVPPGPPGKAPPGEEQKPPSMQDMTRMAYLAQRKASSVKSPQMVFTSGQGAAGSSVTASAEGSVDVSTGQLGTPLSKARTVSPTTRVVSAVNAPAVRSSSINNSRGPFAVAQMSSPASPSSSFLPPPTGHSGIPIAQPLPNAQVVQGMQSTSYRAL